MKKLITLSALSCLLCISLNAQVAVKWTKNFGGTSNDQIGDVTNYYDAPNHSIIKTNDGGYAFVGFSSSSDIDALSNQGANDILLVRVDINGNKLWSKSYGGSNEERVTSVVQTSDGGFAITGNTLSSDVDFSSNKGGEDVFIIRIDSIGNIVWTKTYGGTNDESAYSILEASNGDLVIGCFTSSNDSDITTVTHGSNDFWFLRVDATGSIVNSVTYGGSSNDWLNSICATTDGGFMLCGWTTSSDFDITNAFGGMDYWVVKTDSAGTKQWEKSFGGSSNDWGASIIPVSNNFTITGGSTSGVVTGVSFGGTDIWTIQIDSLGNVIWQNQFGGSGNDEGYEVIHTMDNGYALVGATISDDGQIVGNFGSFDFVVVKLDSAGNTIWTKSLGGSGLDWAVSAVEANNGDIVVLGSSPSNDYYVQSALGGWDLWLTSLTSNFNTVQGRMYRDLNSNTIYDAGDLPLVFHMLKDTVSNQFGFSDSTGMYSINLIDTGNYFVSPFPILYHAIAPADYTGYFSTLNNIDTAKDFAVTAIPGINDLSVSFSPLGRFRPGFNATYIIEYCNLGTTSLTPTITMVLDTQLTYVTASVSPTTVSNDTIVWTGVLLNPGDCASISISAMVSATAGIGDTIITGVSIDGGVSDTSMENNLTGWLSRVTGSFDPNDKAVNQEVIYSDQLADPDYLNYIIRFQNTGNDTAFTVLVTDFISTNLDINTLEIVNASHSVVINYDNMLRLLTFRFANILLADSNTNEPASHGFIHYKLKPITGLAVNDVISNVANIYFDFNDPVITNTVSTYVQLPLSVNARIGSTDLVIYPNPVSTELRIDIAKEDLQKIRSYKIYDVSGKLVIEGMVNTYKNGITIPVSSLVSGVYFLELNIDGKSSNSRFVKN